MIDADFLILDIQIIIFSRIELSNLVPLRLCDASVRIKKIYRTQILLLIMIGAFSYLQTYTLSNLYAIQL